jgi:hypothetical protein
MAFPRTGIGVAVLAALSVRLPIPAQLPPPQAPTVSGSVPTMRSQTRVVQIDVVVKDSRGRNVGDLYEAGFYGD